MVLLVILTNLHLIVHPNYSFSGSMISTNETISSCVSKTALTQVYVSKTTLDWRENMKSEPI
jgi:hypothetical protein